MVCRGKKSIALWCARKSSRRTERDGDSIDLFLLKHPLGRVFLVESSRVSRRGRKRERDFSARCARRRQERQTREKTCADEKKTKRSPAWNLDDHVFSNKVVSCLARGFANKLCRVPAARPLCHDRLRNFPYSFRYSVEKHTCLPARARIIHFTLS